MKKSRRLLCDAVRQVYESEYIVDHSKVFLQGVQFRMKNCKSERDKIQNVQHAEQVLNKFSTPETDPSHLYVLPELLTTGHDENGFLKLNALAEDVQGSTFNRFSRLARQRKCHISYGIARSTGRLKPRISQVVLNAEGRLLTYYDQMHHNSLEKKYFEQGDSLCTFDLNGTKIGILSGHDLFYPEIWRALAWEHGCDAIIHTAEPSTKLVHWKSLIQARSLENQIPILSVGQTYSMSCCANGSVKQLHEASGVLNFEVNTESLEQQRFGHNLKFNRHSKFDKVDTEDVVLDW